LFRGIVPRMSTSRALSGALAALLATPALAGGIGYAQATGYLKKDSRPTLYQPLNLLDGRDVTAWCSTTSDPLSELLTFGFNGPVKLEELRISTGNNFDASTWAESSRARKFLVKSGKQQQTINVEDVRGVQSIQLNPPMVGSRFIVEVLDQYPSEDPDASVCVTDVVFVSEGKPLNGPWLTTKLKYDKAVAGVMGTWYAGFEGTPDRFLHLNFDGTFRYSYEPFDTRRNQEKVLTGTYDVSSAKLTFDLGGKKHAVKYGRDAAKKAGHTLTFEGELPEDLKAAWRSVP
jgi:hypothetical protein